MTRKLQIAGGVAIIALAALLAVAWIVLNGAPGQRWAREKFIARLEQMTGGHVELGQFQLRPLERAIDIQRVTLSRRSEASSSGSTAGVASAQNQTPWLQAERLHAQLTFWSLLGSDMGLESLVIEKPLVQVTIDADGNNNLPRPEGGTNGDLFRVWIESLEARDGTLLVNERSLPLQVRAEGVRAQLASTSAQEYRGSVETENAAVQYGQGSQSGSGALRFTAKPERVEIESATWSSGESRLEATGTITNYADPQVELAYSATFQASGMAQVAQFTNLRSGAVQLTGNAKYRGGEFDTQGKLLLRNSEWRSGGVRVRNLNGGVDYSIDPQRVSFSNVFFSVLGGTVTGSVEVQDWRSSQSSPGRQRGSANLRVANIGLHNAATAAASRQFPVDRLSLSGVTSGAVEVRWTGAPNSAVAKFDLGVKPLPARGARPEFDGQSRDFVLGGSATGSYFFASDRLHFESLDLSGPSLQLNLTGVLGTREADARLTVRTSDAGEL
ncbi:MAG: hypothetical protein AB7V46_24885, partial [Thermomicrobiales bacterium]